MPGRSPDSEFRIIRPAAPWKRRKRNILTSPPEMVVKDPEDFYDAKQAIAAVILAEGIANGKPIETAVELGKKIMNTQDRKIIAVGLSRIQEIVKRRK